MNRPAGHGHSRGSPGVVRGEVRGPDGDPVAGARVVVTRSPVPVPEIASVTDAAGRFALGVPAAGEYGLAAHAEAFPDGPATGMLTVPVSPGATEAAHGPAPTAALDRDADVGSDEAIGAALEPPDPRDSGVEVHVVLTFAGATGGEA